MEKFKANAAGRSFRADDKYKLDSSNKGFQMLNKMGWKEGSGLGKAGIGITAPVQAGGGGIRGAGVGSAAPLDVSSEDDAFTL